jgi:hypothetical protein
MSQVCSIVNRQTLFGSLNFPLISWGLIMYCLSCAADNLAEFPAEMIIHFPNFKDLDKPGVWAFPRLLVCLDCGFSRFITPKTELALLAGGALARETSTRQGSGGTNATIRICSAPVGY